MLGRFADTCGPKLSQRELDRFERLLEQPDHDIYAWIIGSAPTPPEFDETVMAKLRAFVSPPTSA